VGVDAVLRRGTMVYRTMYEGLCIARRVGFPFCYPFLPRFKRKAYKFRTRMMEGVMRADAVILSYPKSGRTWVEVMLSRLFQKRLSLPENEIIDFTDGHRIFSELPRLFFTHDDAHVLVGNEFLPEGGRKGYFAGSRTVLLIRHPLDTAVSMYFQQSKRSGYLEGADMYDFVVGVSGLRGGLPTIIRFMNQWARTISTCENHIISRYEDLRKNPFQNFKNIIEFLNLDFADSEIAEAIQFADFASMKKREAQNFYEGDFRVSTDDPSDENTYKTRRGLIGGYTDYFTEAQTAELERKVSENLSPVFGY